MIPQNRSFQERSSPKRYALLTNTITETRVCLPCSEVLDPWVPGLLTQHFGERRLAFTFIRHPLKDATKGLVDHF